MKRAFVGLALIVWLGGTPSAVLANAAHHPGASPTPSNPTTIALDGTDSSVSVATPPTSSVVPGADPPPLTLPPGATEVPISDSADLGVSIEKDARQPSLYDLMMRVMNLMQPHMKQMMGGVPAPAGNIAPNLVVDLDNPLGVKSNSKATPQTGGSGSLIVTPYGVTDPVSAGMDGAAAPTDPNLLRQQLAAVVAEIAMLNKKVAALTELLSQAQPAAPVTLPSPMTQPMQPSPPMPAQGGPPAPGPSAVPAQPAPPTASDSGTRIEL